MHSAAHGDEEQTVNDDMEYQYKTCRILRQMLKEEPAENARQNGQANQHNEGIEERFQPGREEVNQRADNHGQEREKDANFFADGNQLFLACVFVDEFIIDIHRKHCIDRIQDRVKRGNNRAEHDCGEKAHQRHGNDLGNQLRICVVHNRNLIALQFKQCVSDNAGKREIQEPEDFHAGTIQYALLRFFQVLCSQQTLDKGLVCAPGLRAEEEQSKENGRPRNLRRESGGGRNRVQLLRIVLNEEAHTVCHCEAF